MTIARDTLLVCSGAAAGAAYCYYIAQRKTAAETAAEIAAPEEAPSALLEEVCPSTELLALLP